MMPYILVRKCHDFEDLIFQPEHGERRFHRNFITYTKKHGIVFRK